jgi:hypothetical protein
MTNISMQGYVITYDSIHPPPEEECSDPPSPTRIQLNAPQYKEWETQLEYASKGI